MRLTCTIPGILAVLAVGYANMRGDVFARVAHAQHSCTALEEQLAALELAAGAYPQRLQDIAGSTDALRDRFGQVDSELNVLDARATTLDRDASAVAAGTGTLRESADRQELRATDLDSAVDDVGAGIAGLEDEIGEHALRMDSLADQLVDQDTQLTDLEQDVARGQTPAGAVMAFSGPADQVPSGWLLCDGRALDRTTYDALFRAIGTAHGHGDGSTTFHLPDYRGRFLRGVDGTAGRDPDADSRAEANPGGNQGNRVGSVQGDGFRAHSHLSHQDIEERSPRFTCNDRLVPQRFGGGDLTGPAGGLETRPKNIYGNWIINY